MPLRLAVFVSGTGSLLNAMIEQRIPIAFVLADRQCRALKIAIDACIPCTIVPRSFDETFDREAYTNLVLEQLQLHRIHAVAMAGYRTHLAPAMFTRDAYQLKVLNTHPSLLPSFKGKDAVKQALAHGVKITGCTIHWATAELDDGPILAQEAVKVLPGDTVESLHERIKKVEQYLYPELIKALIC